jgi:hypothetical protein
MDVIPPPLPDDDDDVAWALQTAAVQWQRGQRADAVVWLRRAVDSAIIAGNPARTQDLTRLASSVADRLIAEAMARPNSMAPPRIEERDPDDVDELLSRPPPPPRANRESQHSLTSEIPIEFDDGGGGEEAGEEQDGEEDAPTIPPASADFAEDEDTGDEEEVVDAAELFSAHPSGPADLAALIGHGESLEDAPPEPTDSMDGFDEPFGSSALPEPSNPESSRSEDIGGEFDFADSPEAVPQPLESARLEPEPLPFEIAKSEPPPVHSPPSDPPWSRSAPPEPLAALFSEPPPPSVRVPVASLPPVLAAQRPPPVAIELFESSPPPPPEEPPSIVVGGISLDQVRGFEDLPETTQQRLAASATLTELAENDEVAAFGAALVVTGRVGIMPSIADVATSVASQGEVVFTRGTLEQAVPLRVVALEDGTTVASWSPQEMDTNMSDCPWVVDELRLVADRFQAFAGAALGPLGDRLDDSMRGLVMSRLEVKAFEPGETIVTAGKAIPGLHVVGAGKVEVVNGEAITGEASPGDFLFAAEVLAAGKPRFAARAGKSGALVLFAPRSVAHELMMSVPPLLEILAG